MNTDPRNSARAAKLQHDERFDVLRAPRVRRGLVIATALLWLSAVILVWWDLTAVMLVPALLGLGGIVLLNRTVRHVADAPQEALDERLVAVRNAAYRTSYRIVGVATGVTLAALSVAADARFGWVAFDLEGHHLRALLLGFLALVLLLPGAVLAWRERDM